MGAVDGSPAATYAQGGKDQRVAWGGHASVVRFPGGMSEGALEDGHREEAGGDASRADGGGWGYSHQGQLPPAKGTSESPIYSTDHQWADVATEPPLPAARRSRDLDLEELLEAELASSAWSPLSPARSCTASDEIPVGRACAGLVSRLREHRGDDGNEIIFTTMVARFRLNRDAVDLGLMARCIPHGNVIFSSKGFSSLFGVEKRSKAWSNQASILLRPRRASSRGVTATVQSNGLILLHGARSYAECVRVVRKLVSRLRRVHGGECRGVTDFPQSLDVACSPTGGGGLYVDMVKRDFDLGVGLRMDAVRELLMRRFRVEYEPEMFPGLIAYPSQRAKVLVHHTGKVSVTLGAVGERSSKEVANELQEAYSVVCGFLWENLAKVANMCDAGGNCKEKMGRRKRA